MNDFHTEKLSVGTRIRFNRDILDPACGDHPTLIFAHKGDEGQIIGYPSEGIDADYRRDYVVMADDWANPFHVDKDEFEEI